MTKPLYKRDEPRIAGALGKYAVMYDKTWKKVIAVITVLFMLLVAAIMNDKHNANKRAGIGEEYIEAASMCVSTHMGNYSREESFRRARDDFRYCIEKFGILRRNAIDGMDYDNFYRQEKTAEKSLAALKYLARQKEK